MSGETEQPRSQASSRGVTVDQVRAFLRDHPDFLARNPDMIPHLLPPSFDRGQGVLDFQYFMVQRLRGEVGWLHDQQRELIETSRANLHNQSRIHVAVLALLDAVGLERFVQALITDVAGVLNLDVISLAIETKPSETPRRQIDGLIRVEPGTVEEWLGRRDFVLASNVNGDSALFGAAAGLVRSYLLGRVALESGGEGLLAFGSRDPDAFHVGQGTELAGFLIRVVERCLRRCVIEAAESEKAESVAAPAVENAPADEADAGEAEAGEADEAVVAAVVPPRFVPPRFVPSNLVPSNSVSAEEAQEPSAAVVRNNGAASSDEGGEHNT